MKLFASLLATIVAAQAVQLPPNFKKCNRHQPDFRGCLLDAARFGATQLNRPYKELKMASLDPLYIPKIQASVNTPLVNISSDLTDCKFHNLVRVDIEKFDIDFEAKTLHLAAFWPELKSECYFKIDGHMLRNRVQGEGPSSAIYRKFKWTFDMTYEEAKRRNKTYVKPVTTSFDGKPESVFMDMGFLGIDKEMGERINKIVNDNWSELYDDVKGYYLENARDTWVQIMHGWFARLSLEEAFD